MIRNNFKVAALLLTGVLLCAPTFAGGDNDAAPAETQVKGGIDLANPDLDADPLPASGVAAEQRRVETTVITEVSTSGELPAEIRVEVRVKLDSLNSEYEEIKRKQKELEELRESDREEFERRIAALENGQSDEAGEGGDEDNSTSTGGLTGAVDDVVDVVENGPPAGTDDAVDAPVDAPADEDVVGGSSDSSADPDATTLPPATDPDAGLPGTEPEKKPTWWQKLLKAVAKEAGKALGKWVRGKLEGLRDKADAYANDVAANNPKWKTAIAGLFANGIDDVLSGKYNGAITGAIDKVANKIGGGSSSSSTVPAPPALPAATTTAADASIPAIDPASLPPLPPSPLADRNAGGNAVVNSALGQ